MPHLSPLSWVITPFLVWGVLFSFTLITESNSLPVWPALTQEASVKLTSNHLKSMN